MALEYPSNLTSQPTASNSLKWGMLAVLILLGLGVWYIVHQHGSNQQNTEKSQGASGDKPRANSVRVAAVAQQNVKIYLDALGTVTPRNAVTVTSQITGPLLRVAFTEGQMVKAGQLLAEIDPQPYQAQLAQAQGQLIKDEALLANARVDMQRYETLWKQDSIAKQQVDTQAALIRQYQGAVAVDQAQIKSAKVQLGYTRIVAPISGRIGLRQIDPGNIVQASTGAIATIAQLQPITVLFSVPQSELPAIVQRMQQVKSLPTEAYNRAQTIKIADGSLLTTDNQIDVATDTIKMRAIFNNQDNALFPNQFVNIKLLLDEKINALVMPVAAMQRAKNGDFVYVFNAADSTVHRQTVKTGYVQGELVIVEDGLKAGDQLVVDGTDKLKDGAKVKVVSQHAANADDAAMADVQATQPATTQADGTIAAPTPQNDAPAPATAGEAKASSAADVAAKQINAHRHRQSNP